MSFGVTLSTDFLAVDAGSTTPLAFTLTNRGGDIDTFEVVVEGIDPDWVTLPTQSLVVEPGQAHEDRILLRPQREPASAVGRYPFTLRVRSLNSGTSDVAVGTLEIKAFHQVSLDVEHKRLSIGGLRGSAELPVNILNLSNVEHQLQVFANEPENRYHFSFDYDKVTVGPGQQRQVIVTATPKRRPLIASPRLDSISLSARSIQHPTVAAYAQVQLEQRPAIPAVPALLTLLVGLLGFAWWSATPRAPQIEVFELTKAEIVAGEGVNVVYRVSGAKKINLKSTDGNGTSSVQPVGEWTYVPREPGSYTITLVAEGTAQARRTLVLKVNPAPVRPKPSILAFDVRPRQVEEGKPIMVTYRLNEHVTQATLQPWGYTLNPARRSETYTPPSIGEITLELVAESDDGSRVSEKVKIEVLPKSRAVITTFNVSPSEVPAENTTVTVEWATESTTKAEIRYEGKILNVDPRSGLQEIALTKSGPVELVATDVNGRTVRRTVHVKVRPSAPPADPEPTPTPVEPGPSSVPESTTGTQAPPR